MRLLVLAIGIVAALSLGGCKSPSPEEVCDDFEKDVRAVGVNDQGVAVYRCESRDAEGEP